MSLQQTVHCTSKLHMQYARFTTSSVIGHIFCSTDKIHNVFAADRSLRIQTAHSKRKCNQPLNIWAGFEPGTTESAM
jgi:hypothetical protein